MSSWEKKDDKTQQSASNNDQSVNNNNTPNTFNVNTAPVPPMYYYQPFRPQVNPMMGYPPGNMGYGGYPGIQGYGVPNTHRFVPPSGQNYFQGHVPYTPAPMNMGYMHTGYPTAPQPLQASSQRPQNQYPKPQQIQNPNTNSQPVQNQRLPQQQHQQVKKPVQNQKKPQNIPAPQASSVVGGYNLDDPEELEKWKAERRKKFPSAKKEVEKKETPMELTETKSTNDEEGELSSESENDKEDTDIPISQKRRRICKYFARGKCNKGDSCQFEHVAKAKKAKTESSSATSRPTIFENLLKIEEKQSMLKFYECIKLIIQK